MLVLPTFVGSAVSRKWVASLLVSVSVGLAGVEGVAALKLMFPCSIRLLPITGLLKLMTGAASTVMGAVIVVTPGEDTLRFAVPWATPVTEKVTESCPGATVAVAGTVATAVLSEERLNVIPPAGAAAEIVSATFVLLVAFTLIELGFNESVTVTVTLAESGANPVAVPVIEAEPIAAPVTCGFADGIKRPAGTNTLCVTEATAVLELVKLIVRPPVGAAKERLTGRLPLCPGPKTGTVPKLISFVVIVSGAVAVT